MPNSKKVFITGGAGFIGSTLAGRLVKENTVVIYDNFRRNSIKDQPFAGHPNLKIIRGDVLDVEHLSRAMEGADIVVHCAAIAGIDNVIISPVTTMRVNMVGSANVLEACARLQHCDRVLCFSTSEVFGSQAFRSSETDKTVMGILGEARWTYAVSKIGGRASGNCVLSGKGLPTTVVRPFNAYGPAQDFQAAQAQPRFHVLRSQDSPPLHMP